MGGLISDIIPFEIKKCDRIMVEGASGSRPVTRVSGIFQRANVVNANGRMYPRKVLSKAVDALQEAVKCRSVLGEFDHPTDAKIHMDRACQLITKVWMEGDNVYGECEILEDMPCGKMLKTLIDNKVRVSVSSRGVGDMESIKEGDKEYQKVMDGYTIVTWDTVHEPSVKGTELSVMESRNRMLDLKVQFEHELLEEIKDMLR
jgi:hypothetical protein